MRVFLRSVVHGLNIQYWKQYERVLGAVLMGMSIGMAWEWCAKNCGTHRWTGSRNTPPAEALAKPEIAAARIRKLHGTIFVEWPASQPVQPAGPGITGRCAWLQKFAALALCGLLTLSFCSQARAGSDKAAAASGAQRNATIALSVLRGFGGSVTSARFRWERERLSLFGWLPNLFRHQPAPISTKPSTENILVSGSVEPQMGYSNRLGSHVDIVVIDRKGRPVEWIVARYLPSELTIRPRDPIGRRAFFAETLATPPRAIRSIGLRYHHGPDEPGENHL